MHELSVTRLGILGTRGRLHRDINGEAVIGYRADGTARQRGPFDIVPLESESPTFPVLWSHQRERERQLIVNPDREAKTRAGADEEAVNLWATASRLHFSLDFRLNAQSLAACMTAEPTLGGRAWPNVRLKNPDNELAIALWANSTLGLLLFWWDGKLEHAGRSCLTISQLPDLTVLDARRLDNKQRQDAAELFKTLRDKRLRPAHEADRDETRQQLDEELLTRVLGLPRSALEAVALARCQVVQRADRAGNEEKDLTTVEAVFDWRGRAATAISERRCCQPPPSWMPTAACRFRPVRTSASSRWTKVCTGWTPRREPVAIAGVSVDNCSPDQ